MGVSLYTTSRVAIGFNQDVAWSHTVSTGTRSTLYALDLDPNDPTRYRYGDGWRRMTRTMVAFAVKQANGTTVSDSQPVYLSPLRTGGGLRPAAVDGDARLRHSRREHRQRSQCALPTTRSTRPASIDDVENGDQPAGYLVDATPLPPIAHGTAFYADISVVPNIDARIA